MATYAELVGLRSDSNLGNKVAVAIAVKAHSILQEATPGSNRKAFAEGALASPSSKLSQLFNYVLAENKDATVANIQLATDAAIQANVNDAIDAIVPSGA